MADDGVFAGECQIFGLDDCFPGDPGVVIKQRTLKSIVRASGVGLHTGEHVDMTLRPAEANAGIAFRRVDLDRPVVISANVAAVGETRLSTTLVRENVRISTVEHLLSAFAGLGIDNAYVDVNAPEVPIMDGSAAPFVALIRAAGVEEQGFAKRFIRIKRAIQVSEGQKVARLEPFDGFKVRCGIDFDHPALTEERCHSEVVCSPASFVDEVSRARTFGFLRDIEMLHENGLALGGSMENAIVMDDRRVLNAGGLRCSDECVKHKILDAIGDLYLLGFSLIGAFSGFQSGHGLNIRLLEALLADQAAWEETTFSDAEKAPFSYRQPACDWQLEAA